MARGSISSAARNEKALLCLADYGSYSDAVRFVMAQASAKPQPYPGRDDSVSGVLGQPRGVPPHAGLHAHCGPKGQLPLPRARLPGLDQGIILAAQCCAALFCAMQYGSCPVVVLFVKVTAVCSRVNHAMLPASFVRKDLGPDWSQACNITFLPHLFPMLLLAKSCDNVHL